MTLNDLIKAIPENMRDAFVRIYIPTGEFNEAGWFPLIQVSIEQKGNNQIEILLEADYAQ